MASDTQAESVIKDPKLSELLTKVSARDRANIEKHLVACEADPNKSRGQLWRQLVIALAGMAPMPVTMLGTQAMLFFVADGKFRMQVFAMEDKGDGLIQIYMPDIMQQALRSGTAVKAGEEYVFGEGAQQISIPVAQMDSSNTLDPPAHAKHLIGWNRKAIRATLNSAHAGTAHVNAIKSLATLASKQWKAAASK